VWNIIVDSTEGHYGIVGGTPAATTGFALSKPVTLAGGTDFTSVASVGSRDLFDGLRFPIKLWAPTAANPWITSSKVGTVSGRWLPLIGYAMMIWDLESIREEEYRRLRTECTE
jgi:hypothetical protein